MWAMMEKLRMFFWFMRRFGTVSQVIGVTEARYRKEHPFVKAFPVPTSFAALRATGV
jgi:hypothetical protein